MAITIYVETDLHHNLLEFLLYGEFGEAIEIVNANGQSSAITRAGTRLSLKQQPTILILDTQTQDFAQRHELEQNARYLIRRTTADTPYKILLAVPELEILLTFDKTVLEQLMGRTLSEAEWQLAQVTPRKFLYGDAQNREIAPLLSKLNDEHITRIRQHPLMQELIAFLTEVSARVEE